MLKRLHLSPKGEKDLRRAIVVCVLTNLTLFFPYVIIMQVMQTLIAPLHTGAPLDTGRLWLLFAAGVAVGALYWFVYGVEYDRTYTTAYQECTSIRVEVAERMRKLPLSFFNRKDLSELTTHIMGDCASVEQMISHAVPQIAANLVSIALAAALLAVYDWRMTLALLFVLPLSALIILGSRRVQQHYGERHVQAKLEVSRQVQEYLDGIKVVKAFGLSGEKSAALKASLQRMMKEAVRFEGISGSCVVLASMLLQVGIGLVILVGVSLLTAGELDIVKLLTFTMVSTRIYAPILAVLTMYVELTYFITSAKRMQRLRQEPVMEGAAEASFPHDGIELRGVTFAYGKKDVIHDLSATFPQNAVTALVGPSGSGKSTVARLIARFWDVDRGEVRIGGQCVRGIDPEALMRRMSFVFQDVVLFNDTVMNNIRIGRAGASDAQVRQAARVARCDGFIAAMPQGYDTLIGENGCTLSGGERQRISIARAILKDAPIVLLDEATASLDPENEVLIQEAISALIANRTVIVIAHRLKTIAGADKILVLEDGCLVEEGTHDALIQQGGLYARLWRIQQESLGWSV